MTDTPKARLHPEDLLVHAGWLQGLARRLVADEASADDVVQQTWLRTAQHPPEASQPVSGWLTRVLRNEVRQLRRSERSRSRRQQRVSQKEAGTPSAASLVQRAEQQRRLTELVLELEEPYRETILLRYWEGLEPSEIAKRRGLPASTVRARLKRGLDRLRVRLDRENGGDRNAWVLALAPLAQPDIGSAAATSQLALGGLAIMTSKFKVLLFALLLAIPAGGIALLSRPADHPDPERATAGRPQESPVARRAEAADDPQEGPVSSTPRASGDAGDRGAGDRAMSEPQTISQVRLRFVGEGDAPLALEEARDRFEGGTVELMSPHDLSEILSPSQRPAREVALQWTEEEVFLRDPLEPGQYQLFVMRPQAAPMLSPVFTASEDETAEVTIPLPLEVDGRRVRLVEASTGLPVAGAQVTPWFEKGDDDAFLPGRPRVTDTAGEVFLPLLEEAVKGRHRQPTWWAETDSLAAEIPPYILEDARPDETVEVPMPQHSAVTGHAWLPSGEPAAGREVFWRQKGLVIRSLVEADGSFLLEGIPCAMHSRDRVYLVVPENERRVFSERVELEPGKTNEVVFGDRGSSTLTASVVGRLTAGGEPLLGALVTAAVRGKSETWARSDAEGRYRLEGLTAGEALDIKAWFGDAQVIDDFWAGSEPIELKAGETRHIDLDLPGGAFLVRVVDADTGSRIPNAIAYGRPENEDLERDRFPGFRYSAGWGCLTNGEGEATLLGMVPGAVHMLMAGADGYERAELPEQFPGTIEQPREVTIPLTRGR